MSLTVLFHPVFQLSAGEVTVWLKVPVVGSLTLSPIVAVTVKVKVSVPVSESLTVLYAGFDC